MVQRKDTPAARMALAKRRQRAAQNLNSSNNNNISGDGNNENASTTASAASFSTAEDTNPRSVHQKKNNASSSGIAASPPPVKEVVSAAPHWKGRPSNRRPSPKAVPSGRNAISQQPETERAKAAITSHDKDALEALSERISRKGETTHKSGGGGGHTVAGQTVDGTITTAALTASTMGQNRQEEEELRKDSAGILDAPLSKSKSFGTATEESTVGEANIETVLREDGSGFEYVQEVEVRQHRRRHHNPGPDASENIRERYEPISNFGYVEVTSPQPKSGHELRGDTMQPYYPQPRSPDAIRQEQPGTPTSSHIPRPPTDSRKPRSNRSPLRQHQRHQLHHTRGTSSGASTQRTISPASTAREEQSTTSSSEVGKPVEHPSLNQSSAVVRPDESQEEGVMVKTSDMSYDDPSIPSQRGPSEAAEEGNRFVVRSKARDVSSATGIPKLGSQQGRPPTSPVRPFQRPPSPSSRFTQHKETQPRIEKAASLKSAPSAASSTGSVDRLTVSTGGLAVMRKSRIPSPTPINPGGKRPLPQRSISSPKSNASPEKRPSPKRFNLPPTGRNASPPKHQLRRPQTNAAASSVATSSATANPSIAPSHTSQGGSGKSRTTPSFVMKRMGASDSTLATNAGAPGPSVKTVHSPESKFASASNSTRSPSPKQSPRVDRVSSFLKDACNLKDNGQENMHKQAQLQKAERLDPVLQSRTDAKYFDESHVVNKTPTVQRSTNDAVDDQLDSRVNTWSASKKDVASPIERYRAAADHYDRQQEQQRVQQERVNQHPSQNQYPDQDQQVTRIRQQYQFQNPVGNENFGPTTPKVSKSQGERYREPPKYSYESPHQTTAAENHRNIFQTPQTASPLRKQSLQSPAVVDDAIHIGDGDVRAADAASLCSGHRVVLRSCLSCTTIQAIQNDVIANMQGLDLGLEKELLEVVKIHQDGIATSTELKYGDIIVLRSTAADGKAFGIRKRRRDIKGMDEFGFFDIGNIKSDRWMILPARPDKEVVIGRTALSTKNASHHTSDDRGIVQSGSPIILRNCYNGGVLSVQEDKLALLTDSYNRSRPGGPEDDTLLGRLQHHDKLSPSISESFQLVLPSVPPCPAWPLSNGIGERVFLTGSYLKEMERVDNGAKDGQSESLFSPRIKEAILIDEVIGSFLGLEGHHIRLTKEKGIQADEHQHAFHLVDTGGRVFDLSLRNLVEQILPLATSYVRVRNFLATHYPGYEYGRVMQAFCEGLDSYLYQFTSFVSDLEQKLRKPNGGSSLTMKGLHYEITPLLHSMSILDDVTEAVAATKGGALINTLWSLEKRVYMGDTVAKELIGTLLDKCSVPYVHMLTTWLQSGTLCDPYEEFMVFRPSVPVKRMGFDGDSWSSLLQVNEKHVIKDIIPNEKIKWKILVTGKYWNAVQACNVDVKTLQEASLTQPKIRKFRFQSDSSAISTYIDTTYQRASTSLISLLKDKFKLIDSLQTVKRYFLLDQGDFFMNFLDTAEGDIESCSRFLDGDDRQIYPSALRCRFLGESLVAYLDSIYGGIGDLEPKTPSRQAYGAANGGDTGFDLFTIDFAMVPFPTSLILSRHSMDSYKLLFRQLFFSKHVERRLVGVWSDHQMLKKLDSLRGLLGPSFLLRQRMLHFVQNLNNYMTFEVIESNWLEMMSAIDGPETSSSGQHEQTVDDLLEIHDSFIGKTLDACLLTNPSLIKSLTKLLKTCLLFTEQMKRFMDTTKIYDDSINLATEKRGAVQRNLNERGSLQAAAVDKKKLRRALDAVKAEREMLHHRQTRRVGREVCSDSYKRMVHRFEEVFSADLALFMMQLNSHTASGMVANLGLRLDWNGFITSSIPVH